MEQIVQQIRAHPEFLDTNFVRDAYRSFGLDVMPDPFNSDVLAPIKKALVSEEPLSVLRLGDGETNMLTYGAYANTPNLDRYAFSAHVADQKDSFHIDKLWMIVLRDLMLDAVHRADIVGVVGLWRSGKTEFKGAMSRLMLKK